MLPLTNKPPGPAWLATLDEGMPFHIFPFETNSLLAGRVPEAEIHLDQLEISRLHCRFTHNGNEYYVEDLGSRAGTRVNGTPITQPTRLLPGARISIGLVTFLFGTGEQPANAKEAAEMSFHEFNGNEPVLFKGKPVESIRLGDSLVFGRAEESDVVLRASEVSRQHVQIERCATGFLVTDLKSRTGSLINGQRYDQHELAIGDRLKIGPFDFQFDGLSLRRVPSRVGAKIEATRITRAADAGALLIQEVSFKVNPGSFTGIIGPSGAGKSTLLGTLCGIHKPERGAVLMDGFDFYSEGSKKKGVGLVPQEDIVHTELTVWEALTFSARLRLAKGTPGEEIHKLVIRTMKQLGLHEQAGKRISRLSGGQRKRVSVGVELLAQPAVLYLDEPTSGLDPATEFQLMELLRNLADTGCTIICTTHVIENVYLMDHLLVMGSGKLVFSGSPLEALEHFKVDRLSAIYQILGKNGTPDKSGLPEESDKSDNSALPPANAGWQPSVPAPKPPFALGILLSRQMAILKADWKNFAFLLGQPVVIAALVSWVTSDSSLALFFAYVATLWFGCSNAAQEIVRELPIFKRERIVGVGCHSYLLSKFVFLGITTCLQALVLFLTMELGARGLGGSIPWQIGGLLSVAFASVGIGLAISAVVRSVMQAVLIVPLCLIPLILFSGQPVPAHEMKPPVSAVARLTPSYATQSLMDVSFLWDRSMERATLSDHWTSFRNLNRNKELKTGEVYRHTGPGLLAFLTNLLWAIGTYFLAITSLKKRSAD